MIALAIHIFSVQTKLLYHLNPEQAKESSFSFLKIDEPTLLSMVFAISYSLATVSVLIKTKKMWLTIIFASLDAIGVLLYYCKQIPVWLGALYFAAYTFTLILSIRHIDKQEYLTDQIAEMKEKGKSQREIAQELKVSESKVSRVWKQRNGSEAA
jgi:hypothetical protein